ncbi:hypothetical protein RRG08_032303 [Elysia crispata]|uniref:Uncharacterized protein n=1 Tax=Elysia crispata TaxID=231223 RepID=A0AAE1ASR9_9GAST|nr:hypothetical protein RRG08_032303 [Elysia crispata]
MHQPKPKSAPASLKSKFVKNRTNAMKEIQAWIRKDGEPFPVPEASRMSGQLTDNVTEERMLKAKLWELSKERYKFLSQNSYEQKVFSDRQQRKAGLRRVASASWDSRSRLGITGGAASRAGGESDEIPPGGLNTPRHSSLTTEASSGDALPVPKRTKPKNARFSLLDRLDPTKKRAPRSKSSEAKLLGDSANNATSAASASKASRDPDVSGESLKSGRSPFTKADRQASMATSRSAPQTRSKTTSRSVTSSEKNSVLQEVSASNSSSDERMLRDKSEGRVGSAGAHQTCGYKQHVAPSTPTPIHSVLPNKHQHHNHSRNSHLRRQLIATPITLDPTNLTSNSSSNNNKNSDNATTAGVTSRTASATTRPDLSLSSRAVSRFGGPAAETMAQDPRYARLERTLCPLVRGNTTGDIGAIVNQIEALHVRPRKRPPDAKKTKIELKAFEYMKDKGFAF